MERVPVSKGCNSIKPWRFLISLSRQCAAYASGDLFSQLLSTFNFDYPSMTVTQSDPIVDLNVDGTIQIFRLENGMVPNAEKTVARA